MLDHHHRVAAGGELAAELGEPSGVPRVQADRRLVQHVEGAGELGPELVGEVDALRFAARQGPRLPREGEVAEADPEQERELGAQQLEHVARHGGLPLGEGEGREERVELLHRLEPEVGHAGPRHPHREGLRAQPPALAARAGRLAAVAREEDPHVQLVTVGLDLLEEAADPGEPAAAVVDPAAILLGQRRVRHRRVHPALLGRLQELLLVPAARGVRPRLHRAVGQALGLIRHHPGLVVAQHVAEALALRAGAERVVEREEQRLGAGQGDPAGRAVEVAADRHHAALEQIHRGAALALGQRGLERVGDAPPAVRTDHHPVQHHREARGIEIGGNAVRPALDLGQVQDLVARLHAREAALEQGREERAGIAGGLRGQGEADHPAGAGVIAQQGVGHLVGGVAPRLGPAGRAVDPADLGEEETEVVVQLGRGAHGGPRGAHRVLLLERDGGTDVLDPVHVRPVEPLQEHARVRRQRLDVAPLAFREEGVEREGRLARPRDPGDHGEPVVGNVDGDVLQVVLPGSLDAEPHRLGHSSGPPEMESLLDGPRAFNSERPEHAFRLTAARRARYPPEP